MKAVYLSLGFALVFILISCNNNASFGTTIDARTEIELDTYSLPGDTKEFRAKRYYNDLLRPYVTLTEDNLFKLDITEDAAWAVGVPQEMFRNIKQEIEETNAEIVRLRAEGQELTLPNPSEEIKKNNLKRRGV